MKGILFVSILMFLMSGVASANGLSEALDTALVFETGGDADWFSQTMETYFDGDAAASGDIWDGQVSWMRTTVNGVGTLGFYWRVSSELNYDYLEFYIDGVRQDRISGWTDWHQMIYSITGSGSHTLEWRYRKDASTSNGNDLGRVDLVDWSGGILPPTSGLLSEALDTNLSFTTDGDLGWFAQTAVAYFDGDAVQSGGILDTQSSLIRTTVNGAATVSFFWKVSSEVGYDFLEFFIDGVLQDQISGLVNWHQMMYTITDPGSHILEWRYMKDYSVSEGDDSGWIDRMEWSGTSQPPSDPLSEALDTSLSFTTDGDIGWFSQTAMSYYDGDAAQSGDVLDNQESMIQTTVTGVGTMSFYWKVSSEAGYDFLEFYIDGVLQDRISGSVDWHQMIYTITGSGLHVLDWRYVKDYSVNEGDDNGWLDFVVWSGSTQPPSGGGPLSEALDTTLNLSTGGDEEWFSQTAMSYYDGDAAQSGVILDNQNSLMQTIVIGAGTFSFYWKVSSEDNYDFLEFYIDGILQNSISGTVGWHQMMYTISDLGSHILKWRYVKDWSESDGYDAGWVDRLEGPWSNSGIPWNWGDWWIEFQ